MLLLSQLCINRYTLSAFKGAKHFIARSPPAVSPKASRLSNERSRLAKPAWTVLFLRSEEKDRAGRRDGAPRGSKAACQEAAHLLFFDPLRPKRLRAIGTPAAQQRAFPHLSRSSLAPSPGRSWSGARAGGGRVGARRRARGGNYDSARPAIGGKWGVSRDGAGLAHRARESPPQHHLAPHPLPIPSLAAKVSLARLELATGNDAPPRRGISGQSREGPQPRGQSVAAKWAALLGHSGGPVVKGAECQTQRDTYLPKSRMFQLTLCSSRVW
ncbi:uncharacterized protein LOC120302706 [Crotalus tigris]|uniref:uncharacterized protein LOC120302706 n=1 Tax=Crotalus tigris TaxID=88082 RepID=UPI00192F4404|nr:uncharacterized protein LOC120302706 [Crotalus tigris]